jgi:hypothetical protein
MKRREPQLEKGLSPDQRLFGNVDGFDEKTGSLDEAIRSGDTAAVAALLGNHNFLEGLLIRKGEDGVHLQRVQSGVATLESAMPDGYHGLSRAEQMEALLREGGASPMALGELIATHYHLRDDDALMRDAGALLSVGDTEMPTIAKAHTLNVVGSMMRRNGDPAAARQRNRTALEIVSADPAAGNDPNLKWIDIKLRHGMVVHRAADDTTYEDMPEKMLGLTQRRAQLGDVMHVGRTLLDVARLHHNLGENEAAAHYARQSYEQQMAVGYENGAVKAAKLLGEIHAGVGDVVGSKRIYGVGIGIGERMQEIVREELDDMRTEMERTMEVPATCLVKIGDQYLVQQMSDYPPAYMCLTVDQHVSGKKKVDGKKGDRIAQDGLADLLNTIHAEIAGPDAAEEQRIRLNTQGRNFHFAGRERDEDGNKRERYVADLTGNEAANALSVQLDKSAHLRYILMSSDELERLQGQFDNDSKALISRHFSSE